MELLICCLSSYLFTQDSLSPSVAPISCFHRCSASLKAVPVLLLSLFLPHTPCPFTWRRPKQEDSAAFVRAQIPVWLDFHLILAQHDHALPH